MENKHTKPQADYTGSYKTKRVLLTKGYESLRLFKAWPTLRFELENKQRN